MRNSDWLSEQAERERNSRLYGGSPPRSSVRRATIAAVAWSIGIVMVLSATVGLAAFPLARYGSDEYVLVCKRTVFADNRGEVPATMYAEMREYGQIIRLWSKDAGLVRVDIPNDFYDAGLLRSTVSLLSISAYTGLSGRYSALSGALVMRMGRGREFQGHCARRAHSAG